MSVIAILSPGRAQRHLLLYNIHFTPVVIGLGFGMQSMELPQSSSVVVVESFNQSSCGVVWCHVLQGGPRIDS